MDKDGGLLVPGNWILEVNDNGENVFLRALSADRLARLALLEGGWAVTLHERFPGDELELTAWAPLGEGAVPPLKESNDMLALFERILDGKVTKEIILEELAGEEPPLFYIRLPVEEPPDEK